MEQQQKECGNKSIRRIAGVRRLEKRTIGIEAGLVGKIVKSPMR